jgi:sirohydrochlorin ferrochelatase
MLTALLLVAHGSREPEANEDLHQVAAEMRKRGGFDLVEAAFLEIAEPSISRAASSCVEKGAQRVVMVPYFLSAGIHVRRDLAAHRAELAARFPGVEFRLAEPLGQHPQLLAVVVARVEEALELASRRA